MSKLPRTYYAPDPGYDYDGDAQAKYEDCKTYFDDSVDEQSEAARQFAEEEAQIDYTVPDVCPFCRDGNYCSCNNNWDPKYDDPVNDYDPIDDCCPNCGSDESQRYYISENHAVCACSPLYPNLRPTDDFEGSSCSCDTVKYAYLGGTVCYCTLPDLYALLERQHELKITLNLGLILPDKSLEDNIPF